MTTFDKVYPYVLIGFLICIFALLIKRCYDDMQPLTSEEKQSLQDMLVKEPRLSLDVEYQKIIGDRINIKHGDYWTIRYKFDRIQQYNSLANDLGFKK